MPRIPLTKRRLSTSMSLRVIQGVIDPASLTSTDQLRALAKSSIFLGAVTRWTEDNPRETTQHYQFNADIPGEIDERTPHLIDRRVNIRRAILYKNDLLQSLGFTDAIDLVDQVVPFTMMKVEKAPPELNIPDVTTMYLGCWLHNHPKTYELTGDLLIMQEADVGYTRRQFI